MTLKVAKDVVKDDWGLPYDDSPEHDVEILEDKIVDKGRWSIHHELTVRIGDKFYQTGYSVGATESQEERPWEYDKEVEFTEVKKVEKLVTMWKPV